MDPKERKRKVSVTKTMSNESQIDEKALELSIVMPCLNEERTVGSCIVQAKTFLSSSKINGEIIIADNGSTDHSVEIASTNGAVVIHVEEKGYGNALRAGFLAARGKYIIMADADESYDLLHLDGFIEKLRGGYELVMGNRFKGGIKKGAMPWHHKYIGNPILSFIGKLFFKTPANDFHCGLRGFAKEAIIKMNLQTTGMELASEIVIKASILDMKVCEIPTTLSPDGRDRPPHLRSFRDAWRHFRFLLLFSPRWLFLYPGLIMMGIGLFSAILLLSSPRVHSLLYSSAAMIIGFQLVVFATFTKAFVINEELMPEDPRLNWYFQHITLEVGAITGLALLLLGIGGTFYAYKIWETRLFGPLDPANTMRIVIPSVTSLALGAQIVFSSFFLSVLGLKRR